MKRISLSLLLLPTFITIMAGNYKILYLNSSRIKIDDSFARVGDTFSDKSVIKWSADSQAMKVIDTDTYKRYLFVAKPENGNKQTVYDILMRNKHLSTHDGGNKTPDKYLKLEMGIADEYDLLDSIEIPTELKRDDKHYFLGSYRYGDKRLTKILGHKDSLIIIDKSIFVVNGKKLVPRDITLRISYVNGNTDIPIFIKDNIVINIIPDKID